MKHWLYPANPKYYDVISAFTKEPKTAWPMSSKVEEGDFVYIYSGAPYKQVMFKCKVVEVDLPVDDVMYQAEKYAKVSKDKPNKRFMLLETIIEFDQNKESPLSFSWMRQNGLKGSIMGPQCLENNETLFNYIREMEEQ